MPSRYTTFQFCGRSCMYKHKSTREFCSIKCKVCGENFIIPKLREKTAKYCNQNCYKISLKNSGSILVRCKHCEKEFKTSPSRKRIFCSKKCVTKESYKTFNPNFTTVRKAMVVRGLLNECSRCGYNAYPSILGVHHKDRNRLNNNLLNLEVLCPNCHSVEHSRHVCHGFYK